MFNNFLQLLESWVVDLKHECIIREVSLLLMDQYTVLPKCNELGNVNETISSSLSYRVNNHEHTFSRKYAYNQWWCQGQILP